MAVKDATHRAAPQRRPPGKTQERDPEQLTPREALFVLKVLEVGNQTEAYLRAGYRCTRRTARANAARLLTKASVAKAFTMARQKRLQAAEMDADEAMRSISAIARADIRRLFDEKMFGPPRDVGRDERVKVSARPINPG